MDQLNNNNNKKRKSNLEDIKKKLYSSHYVPKHTRANLSKKEYDINDSWEKGEESPQVQSRIESNDYWGPNAKNFDAKPPKKGKGFIAVLIFAALFFIGSLGYAYYSFYIGSGRVISSNDVFVSVHGPVSVGGGEKLSLDVVIQNNHRIPIELVDLVIDYPPGTKNAADLVTDQRRDRIPLGDMDPNEVIRKNISAALFGEENSVQDISINIEYRISGSNAIYERSKNFGITINAAPVRLIVDGIREISSGQNIEITTKLSSNSTQTLKNIMVIASYPFGFSFESASINPSVDNNIWVFENLDPEEEKEIIIKGTMEGQDNEDRVFNFKTGIKNEEVRDQLGVVWSTTYFETKIQQQFANVAIGINGSFSGEYAVRSGGTTRGTLYFYNNTGDTLRNIEIELKIEGEVLDKRSVRVNGGFYDSSRNAIFWNQEHHEKFRNLESRETLELDFSFAPYDLSDGSRIIDNPEININALSKAVRVDRDNVEETLKTTTPAKVLVLSDMNALAYTSYGDGILNTHGPIPPVAEEETTYAVILEAANGNNKMENVKFVTKLPSYVEWERVAMPYDANISYNENTRELVWHIGDMNPGAGFDSPSKKLYLSITLRPSVSQIGNVVKLINDSELTGFDSHVQKNIRVRVEDATTQIHNRSRLDNHSRVAQ